jgi:hypothetical protein
MPAHLSELGLGQRASLEEHRRGDRELPDVVQERTQPQNGKPFLLEPDSPRHRLREDGHTRGVTLRERVTSFDRSRKSREAPHRLRDFKAVASFPPEK